MSTRTSKSFRNVTTVTLVITFALCLDYVSTKSSDQSVKFIKKQKDKLMEKGKSCTLKKLTTKSLDNLRLTSEDPATVLVCILEAMKDKDLQTSGLLWTALGSLYQRINQESSASTSFKQATKFMGKHTTYIKEWSFLGPFVIGKTEVDGDPVESFGGIHKVSKSRYKKGVSFFSELLPGGEINWSQIKQPSQDVAVQIQPSVNWNELVNALGSIGITEWQGWLVGELAVNEKDLILLVQCHGVHTIYINDIPVTGDVYHRGKYWFGVQLDQGLHTMYIRVRTKIHGQVLCKFKSSKTSFEVLPSDFMPDLWDGRLFSDYLSISVANYHTTNFLKVSKVVVSYFKSKDSEIISKLDIEMHEISVSIAPGQIYPVVLKLKSKDDSHRVISECSSPESSWDVEMMLKVTTSAGLITMPLKLRCRTARQSFLFTFLDHDESVQHAAAVQPLQSCTTGVCPIVLTLHGTTISPQNQADSYKHMVNEKFQFGFPLAWTLAPTRHGAHNWEGPGLLTAMTALESLTYLTHRAAWITDKADNMHVIYAGHSMGGHGALHVATHYPDRALALVTLAGWIKKEEYGDSNLFFRHDIATSHVDPAVKNILESCIVENDADQHVSNLHGVPAVTRIGAADRTVHPWFLRRIYRLLKEEGVKVNHTEVKGMEHWWWDTMETNDGGAVNDKYLRDFKHQHIQNYMNTLTEGTCDKETGCTGGRNKYSDGESRTFTLVCYNPALGEGMYGLRVLQQIVPYRKSEIKVAVDGTSVSLQTRNVARLSLSDSPNRNIAWETLSITIDEEFNIDLSALPKLIEKSGSVEICLGKSGWSVCDAECDTVTNRGPKTLGPARRVAEQPFKIIIGTGGSPSSQSYIQQAAVYIANLFLLTSDTRAPIVMDTDVSQEDLELSNVILIGNSSENIHTESLLQNIPMQSDQDGVKLGKCLFKSERTGVLTVVPNGDGHLGLVLLGNSQSGLKDVVSLASPTIPPMTRSPFSNLIPDYVITGPDFGRKGPGGYLCAGFYGNQWQFLPVTASCVCSTA